MIAFRARNALGGAAVEDESFGRPALFLVDVGAVMGFLDGLWPGRAADFDSGSAATNAIALTKRHHQVSLTRQGAASGHQRVNLNWRMRTSDIGGSQRQSLLRHPLQALKPPEFMGHSQRMVNVALALCCLYELTDGT